MESYQDKILRWSGEESGNEYVGVNTLIRYLSTNLFHDYEPTLSVYPEFESRLNKWLNNHSSEDIQKIMLKLVPKIFYLGREEMNSLYHTAFQSNVKRWLFDKSVRDATYDQWDGILADAVRSTWFCPITDSFRINQFYHINGISSPHEFRPDWRSLMKFGSESKIRDYIEKNKVKYIVLLEDFVGSGGQISPALKYCVDEFKLETLFVPLIICNQGTDAIRRDFKQENFELSPVIELPYRTLVNRLGHTAEELKDFIAMSEELYDIIMTDKNEQQRKEVKIFGHKNTGGLTVMYSNTPNNSLPIIHMESRTWVPLFRRQARYKPI